MDDDNLSEEEECENIPPIPRRRGRPRKQLNESRKLLANKSLIPRRRGRPPKRLNESRRPLPNKSLIPRRRGRPRKDLNESRRPLANKSLIPRRRGRPRKTLNETRRPLEIISPIQCGRGRRRPRKTLKETRRPLANVSPIPSGSGCGRPPLNETYIINPSAISPRRTRGRPCGPQNTDLNETQPTSVSICDDKAPNQVISPLNIVWMVTKSKVKASKLLAKDPDLLREFNANWKDRKRNAIVILGQENNANAGFIAGYEDDDDTDGMYIAIIVVNEQFRRKNIGKMLIQQFEEEARKKEYENVTLVVAEVNNAVHFFQHYGFIRSAEESRFGHGYIDMSKSI